jgi:two-component system cell cycle response regulator
VSPKGAKEKSPSKTGSVTVEVMNGAEDGREIICDRFPITIGRSGESSIGLACDHLISRNHARISKSKKGFMLEDLKSTNGTFIEDKRIRKSTPVQSGQLFRVGATLLRIKARPARESSN